jgi:predicted secreted acid phosphatase
MPWTTTFKAMRVAATIAAVFASSLPALAEQPVLSQPANVGEAKSAATAYHASGAYERDLAAVAAAATAWIKTRAPEVERPALVLDIDETSLSNWAAIAADDYGFISSGPCAALPKGPCGWDSWDLSAEAPAIVSTRAVYDAARTLDVAVFFVTGRAANQRAGTEEDLRESGYPVFADLYMTPPGARFATMADFKAPVRASIEAAGYTIIANIGDQPSDLAGGHAEEVFLLPNPFYRIP